MEKKFIFIILLLVEIIINAQNLEKIAKEITDEGIELYRSEMASWYGTDVFLENHKEKENLGGYFSYIDKQVPKCIFFSNEKKVIATIAFPTNYHVKDSKLDLTERDFTEIEKEYFTIRQKALERIRNDSIFRFYKNVNYNIVPIIKNNQKKVYILSGTHDGNVVLFGNDYVIDFNKKNEITKVQRLHKNLIYTSIHDEKIGKSVGGVHSHVIKDFPYITPTDICTLMLYQKFTNWESYTTISKEFASIWNCKTNHLSIMKTETWQKIYEEKTEAENQNNKD